MRNATARNHGGTRFALPPVMLTKLDIGFLAAVALLCAVAVALVVLNTPAVH